MLRTLFLYSKSKAFYVPLCISLYFYASFTKKYIEGHRMPLNTAITGAHLS